MSEWIDFERWLECVRMERLGIVFEVENGNGQRLFTPCVIPLREPFDWRSRATRYRPVPAARPRHSFPIPKPRHP